VLDLTGAEHVIENRSETAQSHKHGGFYFHFGPPVARLWGAPWSASTQVMLG
jgi:hypothetical protein